MHNILYMAYEFLFQGSSTFEKIFRKEQKSLKKEKQVSILVKQWAPFLTQVEGFRVRQSIFTGFVCLHGFFCKGNVILYLNYFNFSFGTMHY